MDWIMKGKLLHNHSKKETRAICDALNILIWKIPEVLSHTTEYASQEFIVAELADKDIIVHWDSDREEFVP